MKPRQRSGYQHITYSSFDLKWLGGVCAPVTVTTPKEVKAGERTDLSIRVVNQNDQPLPTGRTEIELPAGWKASAVTVPALKPGQGATVTLPVDVPLTATGRTQLKAVYSVRDAHAYGTATVSVTPAANAPAAPRISALPVLDNIQAAGATGALDDVMSYGIRVSNPGNTPLTDVQLTGDLGNLAACAQDTLAPGADYICRGAASGRRTITQADLDQGFTPNLTVSGTAPDGTRTSATATGDHTDVF
ncbi:DUF7507 domain-containing protein [Streptomyces sp. NBC_01766]|uniref:DUF7507 domain-containing protein n=1 Tax=Streptomyces sp. NBC_01766 TaxID=2975936 RepID=UPI002DD87A27|nr:NEW3 domain-containing protein [Streptomyces sp. NBC_01766]WSC21813.1 NEW3 domain-containing protein [Streptomyces sp. NBC_01766]